MIRVALLFIFCLGSLSSRAQDDLISLLGDDSKDQKQFLTNAFKTTRIINTHSVEFLSPGVLDLKIMHRFGLMSDGVTNLYGLDQANMRLGFDYGVTKRLMIGAGRSNVNKELDGFVKYRLLWQSEGHNSSPVSLVIVSGATLITLPYSDPSRTNFYTSRLAYYHQLLIGRKFSEKLTLQLSPTIIHYNLVKTESDRSDIYSVGFGGRFKITKRVSVNWDYQYALPNNLSSGYYNFAALGFDIETGGHVFQLLLTNSVGMNERAFITNTSTNITSTGLRLGFNLSRVFTLHKRKTG